MSIVYEDHCENLAFAGAEPYPGISPWTLPNVLLKGYRMPKPEYVRDELYV